MYRAIVVDDEPFMLEGMRLMIDWAGCGFELAGEADTARKALRLTEQIHPDLVITDIRMPEMMGTELAEALARDYPETVVLFFSGYRDFAYAKAAIQTHAFGYLLKPIDSDEVQKTLVKVKATLDERNARLREAAAPIKREHVLRRLAFGDDSAEALTQCAALTGIGADENVCCAVIEVSGSLPRAEALWQENNTVSFMLSPTMLGVLFRGDADLPALTKRRAELNRRPDTRARIGVGRPGKGGEGFRNSLREAIDALGPRYTLEGALRRYHPFDREIAQWMIDADVITLESALLQRQPETFGRQLEKTQCAYRQKKPALYCLRAMAHNVELSLVGEGAGCPPMSALHSLWSDEISSAEEWMERFIKAMRACAAHRFGASGDVPEAVSQVLRYIDECYAGNATIGDISSKLFMNPAYLGQLVRKHTGDTFHRHLLRARMRQACRMLRQTSVPVAGVAQAVGIHDVDYFSAQFKKHTGLSPNAYRNMTGKDGALP